MPTTAFYGFPYPALSDPPNGPAQFQALAEEMEVEVARVDATATTQAGQITALQAATNIPTFMLVRTTAQSIPAGTWTALGFNVEDDDSHGGHDNATNNDRYTCQKDGLYQVCGKVGYVNNGTGIRIIRLTENGVVIEGSGNTTPNPGGAEFAQTCTPTLLVRLVVGDVIRVESWQNSGGALNTAVTDTFARPCFAGQWLKA